MNIYILAVQPFPYGMAATNRIISYCKGFVELGYYVKVLNIRPTENMDQVVNNENIFGEYFGINFQYTAKTTIWPKNRLKKLWLLFIGTLNAAWLYLKCGKNGDVVLSATINININFIFFILSYFKRNPFIKVEDEYPIMFIDSKKKYSRIFTWFYLKFFFKMFDGMIVISHHLENYYQFKVRKKTPILVVPMTVEPERFRLQRNPSEDYIAYCGYIGGSKDGIPILIDAFKIFVQFHKNIKLYLIGFTNNDEELIQIKNQIQSNDLSNDVILTGRISRDEIPSYLCNAKALVLSRPANKQAEGGFPTKLGEYLATGLPVIVTSVGDIPIYLKDNVNAFISEPGSPSSFANKLIAVFNNYENSLRVGQEGQKLVYSTFNYLVQAKNMIQLINTIL
jgi:glycosyltransferase involved in cell wall biosynthesis